MLKVPGCFHCVLFLRIVRHPQMLGWSLNGSIFPGQAHSQLIITIQLAAEIVHEFSCFVLYVCGVEGGTNSCHLAVLWEFPTALQLPTAPTLTPIDDISYAR